MRRTLLFLAVAACSPPVTPGLDAGSDAGRDAGSDAGSDAGTDAGSDAGTDGGRPACRTPDGGLPTLGLNDVSILVPLQADLVPIAELVPQSLYDRVVKNPDGTPGFDEFFVFNSYPRFHVVAVRFDLCDRSGPGPCPGVDPRFRLVLQRVTNATADDVALHAFYTVPAAELPAVLGELEALARMQGLSTAAPLKVSPAMAAAPTGAYATRLAALLRRYCTTSTLSRLTFFAQPDLFAQIRWVLRGIELQGGAFVDIAIPHATDGGVQHVFLQGNGYSVTMLADVPQGFERVTSGAAIAAATPAQVAQSLAAIAEINDPLSRHVDTLQCVACHVATPLVQLRADAGAVPPRYVSPFDLSLDGGRSPGTDRSLRAFGWLGVDPMISQRVANETAQVLAELQQCR